MIIELAEAKTLLGVTGSDDDTTITNMLNAITYLFERAAHRKIEDATVTEILDGEGIRSLYLREQPRSITSVHISSDQTWDATTLIDSSTYNFKDTLLRRLGNNTWDLGWQNIQVVYAAGFAEDNIPEDIWWAAQKTLQKMWSTFRSEQGEDIDVVADVDRNGNSRAFRDPSFLDAEVLEILRRVAPWME